MYNRLPSLPKKTTTMKKDHLGPKSARINGKLIRNPPPPRKRPPKDNLGDVPAILRAMGPGFRVPGRPPIRVRPPAGHSRKPQR